MSINIFQKTYTHQNKGSKTVYEITISACVWQARGDTNLVAPIKFEKYTEKRPEKKTADSTCVPKTKMILIKRDFEDSFLSWVAQKVKESLGEQ